MSTIKLLLADDERLTREGLRESLLRAVPGIDEVLEAGDGQEALNLAMEHSPEIILTDVRMPHMDGVTFADRIHRILPASSIIFMSGYSDKEYLQAAIRVHAVSYVEKPVDTAEVAAAVRDAVAYHEQMNRSFRYANLQSREKEAQLSLLLSEGPAERGKGTPSDPASAGGNGAASRSAAPADAEAAARLQRDTGFPSAGRNVYTAFLMQTFPAFSGPNDPMLTSLSGALDAASASLPVDHIQGLRGDSVLLIWLASRTELTDYTKEEITRRLTAPLARSRQWFLACGPSRRGAASARESAAQADALLSYAFYADYNTVLQGPVPEISREDISGPAVRYCAEAAKERDPEKLLAIEEQLFTQLRKERCVRPSVVRDTYFKLYIALERGFAGEQGPSASPSGEDTVPIWDRILSCRTFRELHEMMVRDIRRAGQAAASSAVESGPAARMAEYIRKNYMVDTLSVRDISSHVGLSAAYACTVFKSKTGKTMNQYLTDYRMEKARHLLEDPGIRISEVSAQVGYLDGNYFGKSFKKVTGLSPSEYREKLLS